MPTSPLGSRITIPADEGCAYCQSFGGTSICQCPVRIEIFKRYGK